MVTEITHASAAPLTATPLHLFKAGSSNVCMAATMSFFAIGEGLTTGIDSEHNALKTAIKNPSTALGVSLS